MGIKSYNPYTPSRRHMTGSDFSEITKSTPEKSLTVSLKKNAGRNNQGKITVRHRGGGSRRKYRIIDFKRRKDGIPATVVSIEYDPNRTANIALISYVDGEKAYILAPEGLKVGQKVMNGADAEVRVGNCLPLELIPVGTMVHNIELHPGKGGQMVRSAGNGAQLMAKEGKYATLRLPSGEMRMVPPPRCLTVILPWLLRPAFFFKETVRDFSGVDFVISEKSEPVICLLDGVYGL